MYGVLFVIKHIVLFKFVDNITDAQIESAMHKLSDLRHTAIPQIKSFSHGKNCSIDMIYIDLNRVAHIHQQYFNGLHVG